MVGLIILVIAVTDLGVLIWATRVAYLLAKNRGWSRKKCWVTAVGSFLVIYLPLFWDYIPMLVLHNYYCATEAKWEVHVTADEWRTRNSPVGSNFYQDGDARVVSVGEYRRYLLNQRLAIDRKELVPVFPAIRREEARIVDIQNGEVLAEYVEFITGYGVFSVGGRGAWKFWMDTGACKGDIGYRANFGNYQREILGASGGAK